MNIYKKAILPIDFKAGGLNCGIKKSGKPDLALLYSEIPAIASCRFTSNIMQAAPILVCKENLRRARNFQAIVVNSGNANCFTGNAGIKDAQKTVISAARELDIKKENVLVASTGIIGKRMEVSRIEKSMPVLISRLSKSGIDLAKKAILTTDTFVKEITVKFMVGKETVTICGIAKGAGMIAPDMATMLCFILTDANITQRAMDKALKVCVDNSFNCITVDGCMSTNDSVIMLANAAAGNPLIETKENFSSFAKALDIVCLELAKMIIRDAEGATKFIRIKVSRAKDFAQAKKIALKVANSDLFKTAMYGENPNFGRIVAAVGASGENVKERDLKIKVSSLKKKDIFVDVSVNLGKSSAIVYTSDLTAKYIKINAAYN